MLVPWVRVFDAGATYIVGLIRKDAIFLQPKSFLAAQGRKRLVFFENDPVKSRASHGVCRIASRPRRDRLFPTAASPDSSLCPRSCAAPAGSGHTRLREHPPEPSRLSPQGKT